MAAIWELYLNVMFKTLGFRVSKIGQPARGTAPDFLIEKGELRFYVEATSIDDSPTTTEEKLWVQLLTDFESICSSNYLLSVYPRTRASQQPKTRDLIQQVRKHLENLSPIGGGGVQHLSSIEVTDGSWVLDIGVYSPGNVSSEGPAVHMSGSGRASLINDDIDLRNKIRAKRKYYKGLDFPLVLAVLENSFVASQDNGHRMNALYGSSAIQWMPDGNHVTIRRPDGLWDLERGEKKISALLLLDRLRLDFEVLGAPVLWINPHNPDGNTIAESLPLDTYKVGKGEVVHDVGSFRGVD